MGRSRRDALARRIERERRRTAPSVHVLAHPHVGVLLPESVLVNLPVLATVEREGIGHERFGLLPHLVGLLGDKLVFRTPVGFRFARIIRSNPVRKRDFAGACSPHNRVSTLLYHVAQFRAEAFVPCPPERRLIRERLESQALTERGMRSEMVVEGGFVTAVDLLEQACSHQ